MSAVWTVLLRRAAPDGAWPPCWIWTINMALLTELSRGGGPTHGFGLRIIRVRRAPNHLPGRPRRLSKRHGV